MPANHATSERLSPPDWLGLLAIGVERLRDLRAYWWFFALTITLRRSPSCCGMAGWFRVSRHWGSAS